MKYLKYFENTEIDVSYKNKEALNWYLPFNDDVIKIDCSNCKFIEKLPELPKKLDILSCYNNSLIELPKLPDTLTTLYCGENKLTILPELPQTLESLICSDNMLEYLPEIPVSVALLKCDQNNWKNPIKYDIINRFLFESYDVYTQEQIKKFRTYEYQKDFLTNTPEKYKDLYPIGYIFEIIQEFDWLFNAVNMGLM